MADKTRSKLPRVGWVSIVLGLVVILITVGRPSPEGWVIVLGFGLMVGGVFLVGSPYIRG